MDWVLRAFVVFIIAAAVIRGGGLIRYADRVTETHGADLEIREWLGLPGDHRVRRLIVTGAASPREMAVLWIDSSGTMTAIMPDVAGRLRIGRDLAPANVAQRPEPSVETLANLDPSDWPALPPPWHRLSVRVWDDSAPVYITVGPDGQPGIAGVDDDGDGVIDDLGELGATGSDDEVIGPQQPGYAEAAAGEVIARVISRGALVDVAGDLVLPSQPPDAEELAASVASRPREVWLEFTGNQGTELARICLQVH